MAVHSSTKRRGVIAPGHTGARARNGRRETKTTTEALRTTLELLSFNGHFWNQDMSHYVGIDTTRLLSLRRHLERIGAIRTEKRGHRLFWVLLRPELVNFDCVVAGLALEPRWSQNNSDPRLSQIDCTLCGLQTKGWLEKDWPAAWREHLESVCHR